MSSALWILCGRWVHLELHVGAHLPVQLVLLVVATFEQNVRHGREKVYEKEVYEQREHLHRYIHRLPYGERMSEQCEHQFERVDDGVHQPEEMDQQLKNERNVVEPGKPFGERFEPTQIPEGHPYEDRYQQSNASEEFLVQRTNDEHDYGDDAYDQKNDQRQNMQTTAILELEHLSNNKVFVLKSSLKTSIYM